MARYVQPTSEQDERRLLNTCYELTFCSYYLAELTSTQAKDHLRRSPTGTFLIRDSAHPQYIYSLTVKTARGVTSIRIRYDPDGFRLDSDAEQASLMPAFDSAVALIAHYVDESRDDRQQRRRPARSSCVFLDRAGRRDVPVVLKTPCRSRVAPLGHLCRLAINDALDGRSADRLCLQPSLKEYLKKYQFGV